MKSNLLYLVCSLFFCLTGASQSFNFTINPQSQCFNGNNTATAIVTTPAPSADTYTWVVQSQSCSPTYTAAGNGSLINITLPCCAGYTITCSALNTTITPGTPQIVATVAKTAVIICLFMPIYITLSHSVICPGASASFTASGANNYTYTWMPGNLTGSVITVSPTITTCYSVTAQNSVGCANTATACMNVQTCTATRDISIEREIEIYPNPASGFIKIHSEPGVLTSFTIFDVLGRKILSFESSGTHTTDVSDFSPGTYLINCRRGDRSAYKKLVINK
jgi:hypothetical protein